MTLTLPHANCILPTAEDFVAYKDPFLPMDNLTRPLVEARDFVNAFVFNEEGEALVLESTPFKKAWSSWKMLGCPLTEGEDPLTAVQHLLQQNVGCVAKQWLYLGTFVSDEVAQSGANHFFIAHGATAVAHPQPSDLVIRWVGREQIKQALLDGRIAQIHHAVAASLAMLLCD